MSFAADIAKFVERAKGNIDTATRQATVLLAQGVILKSPLTPGAFGRIGNSRPPVSSVLRPPRWTAAAR